MSALYFIAAIRAAEQAALALLPPGTLMQRAGAASAGWARQLVPDKDAAILILAGPGNNGGDALEAATVLQQAGWRPLVLDCATAPSSSEHTAALAHARQSGVAFAAAAGASALIASRPWALVIDGLFGIGLSRPIAGHLKDLISAINQLRCARLALDVPSGLDADRGCVIGADGIALQATHTLTFIGDKPGLHTADGRDLAGCVRVADLGIDPALLPPPDLQLNQPELFAACLQPRRQNSNKGSFGNVVVIGGAAGMAGAPVLSARAALHGGAGRVFIGFLDRVPAYDGVHPELMCRHVSGPMPDDAVMVVGPGLGHSRAAHDALARALATRATLVLDADALNLLAHEPGLQQRLQQRQGATLLTPHPLEAARLLGSDTATIQADRVRAARQLAQRYRAGVILKGSGSIIANPDGVLVINPTGNPALATAGTGDVLAGLCGALLAQHWPLAQAACGAVWLHGHAADQLVASGHGPIGLCASDLIPALRQALNQAVAAYGVPDYAG
jgi:hydroxyethylthiazole kinase-like uncharacterized protein yjeF